MGSLRNSVFLLMPVLIQLSSSSLSAPGPKDLDFDEPTVFRNRFLRLASHEMEVSGLDSLGFNGRALLFVIPTITRLVQGLLDPAPVLDLRIDAPGRDVSSIHVQFEEKVTGRAWFLFDNIFYTELGTCSKSVTCVDQGWNKGSPDLAQTGCTLKLSG